MVRLAAPLRPLFPYLKPAYSTVTRAVAPFSVLASKARGGYLPTGSVRTLEEAAATSGGRSWTVRAEDQITREIPVDHPTFREHATDVFARQAVAELPGGRVLGPHGAVITNRGDLVEEVSLYFGTRRARQHPLHLHPFPPKPVDVPGRLGVIDYKGGAGNWYHFIFDVLPRIALVERCPDLEPPDKWYVPAAGDHRAELLNQLGITPDRRIDSTQVPHVRAETLVVPSVPGDEQHPQWSTDFLRERLLVGGHDRIPGRRLYLTRGASRNNRTVLNDDEVQAALLSRGFELLDPSLLPIDEEMWTFAEADIVVSTHGAGLSNTLFMSPGSLVVELFPEHSVVPCYWKLVGTVPGVDYRHVPGIGDKIESNRQKILVKDITVDIPALLAAVDGHG